LAVLVESSAHAAEGSGPVSNQMTVAGCGGVLAASPPDGKPANRSEPRHTTAVIWGESGADRDRVARTLHERSPRHLQPFISVNCATLPSALLESEIFGYGREAFPGAHRQKPGKIEAAHRGTLFLDEIDVLPLPLQIRLLHVLRDRQVSPLGGKRVIRVDVRVVAGAKEDLGALVARGQFRDDLYRWLNGITLRLSSGRDGARAPALPALAAAIDSVPTIAARAVGRPRKDDADSLKAIARRAALDAERAVLKAVLEQVHWNRLEASRRLKVSYKTLRWKIRQCGLDR
jgi:DNA-binding NtrC family response regulator